MRILTTCIVLLLVTQPVLLHAQKIELQGIAPGAHAEVTNTDKTLKLSGTFGQPITNSDDGILSSGFFASTTSVLSENSPPVITDLTASNSFDFDAGPTISMKFTDPDGIQSATLYIRPIGLVDSITSIAQAPTGSFDKFDFTNSYTASTADFDDVGMEYYFEAIDETGLSTRMPAEGRFYTYAVKPSIIFPTTLIEPGNNEEDYRIISLPYQIGQNDISTLFSALGGNDKSKWRLFSYDGDDSFSEFPNGSARNFTAGESYWFLVSEKSTAELVLGTDVLAPTNNQSELFEMPLKAGWNMVGNPYPITISWEDVRNYNAGVNMNELVLFSGDYANGNDLLPFQGGLVFLDGSDATISIPFKGQSPPSARAARVQDQPFTHDLSTKNWKLDFKIKQGSRTNSLGAIGMHTDAKIGKDKFDGLNPPRFLSYLEINSPHPEHSLGFFSKDIVTSSPQHKWQFTVNASKGDVITLSWDNSGFRNSPIELYLYDVQNQQLIDMRTSDKLNLNNNSTLEIYYGKGVLEDMGPQVPFMGTPYPNPVNTGLTSAIFPVRLSGQGINYQLEAIIYSMEGRVVKELYNGTMSPGLHNLDWNGNSNTGIPTESGMYIYQINVSSTAGQWQFTGKLIIAN